MINNSELDKMEEINKLPRKEREKLQRRSEILEAAVRLFSQKGYNKTTLEEIALEAEFGTGTIYNYFQSKEEIYRSILESTFNASYEILVDVDQQTENILEFFKIYSRKIFEFFYDNQDTLLLFVSYFTSVEEKPINLKQDAIVDKKTKSDQILKAKINKGIENKEIRPLKPEHLIRYYISTTFPYITNLIKDIKCGKDSLNNFNVDEHVDFLLDVLFNGIKTDKTNKENK